jgi:excisionase family DNA binding protein
MASTTASPSTSISTPAARPGTSHPASALDPAVPLPAVLDLVEAAALLCVGRTTAYRLVHDGQWPTPVLRLGRLIKIPLNRCSSCSPVPPARPPDATSGIQEGRPKRAAKARPAHQNPDRMVARITRRHPGNMDVWGAGSWPKKGS